MNDNDLRARLHEIADEVVNRLLAAFNTASMALDHQQNHIDAKAVWKRIMDLEAAQGNINLALGLMRNDITVRVCRDEHERFTAELVKRLDAMEQRNEEHERMDWLSEKVAEGDVTYPDVCRALASMLAGLHGKGTNGDNADYWLAWAVTEAKKVRR